MKITEQCAWCGRVIRSWTVDGDRPDEITHGICPECERKALADLEAEE